MTRVIIRSFLFHLPSGVFCHQTSCGLYVGFYSEVLIVKVDNSSGRSRLLSFSCPFFFPANSCCNSQWTTCSFIPIILASWRNLEYSWNACMTCWDWHRVVDVSLSSSRTFECAVRDLMHETFKFLYSLFIWHMMWNVALNKGTCFVFSVRVSSNHLFVLLPLWVK